MEFSALDSGKMLVLMIAGGVFALAGLWLMFRPKPEGSSAKIELFGLKFESSSAGLMVFLIGAGFLATPLFVPERDATTEKPVQERELADGDNGAADVSEVQTAGFATANPFPISKVGSEVEPNSTLANANIVPVGASVTGNRTGDDVDIYQIDTDGLEGSTLYITLTGEGGLRLQVSLPTAQMVYSDAFAYEGSLTFETPVEYASYFARVASGHGGGGKGNYELTVTAQ